MTHKKEVIQFCQSKIQQIHKYGENIPDKESFVLLWEYLILLLKQKNTLDGSDIAEVSYVLCGLTKFFAIPETDIIYLSYTLIFFIYFSCYSKIEMSIDLIAIRIIKMLTTTMVMSK